MTNDPQMFAINESPERNKSNLDSTPNKVPNGFGGLRPPPAPMYANDARVLKILSSKGAMDMSGPILLDKSRRVIWRNLCMIGKHHIECIVEMSMLKSKFYLVALDLYANKYHVIELWV